MLWHKSSKKAKTLSLISLLNKDKQISKGPLMHDNKQLDSHHEIHLLILISKKRDTKNIPCRYFAKDACNKGADCRF